MRSNVVCISRHQFVDLHLEARIIGAFRECPQPIGRRNELSNEYEHQKNGGYCNFISLPLKAFPRCKRE